MIYVEGEFEGEIIFNSVKYSEIFTKLVIPNNSSSGKIQLPREYISREVIVLITKMRSQKR